MVSTVVRRNSSSPTGYTTTKTSSSGKVTSYSSDRYANRVSSSSSSLSSSTSSSGNVYKTTPSGLQEVYGDVFDQEGYNNYAIKRIGQAADDLGGMRNKADKDIGGFRAVRNKKFVTRGRIGLDEEINPIYKERYNDTSRATSINRNVRTDVRSSSSITKKRLFQPKGFIVTGLWKDKINKAYRDKDIFDYSNSRYKQFEFDANKLIDNVNKELQDSVSKYKKRAVVGYRSSYYYVDSKGSRKNISYDAGLNYENIMVNNNASFKKAQAPVVPKSYSFFFGSGGFSSKKDRDFLFDYLGKNKGKSVSQLFK